MGDPLPLLHPPLLQLSISSLFSLIKQFLSVFFLLPLQLLDASTVESEEMATKRKKRNSNVVVAVIVVARRTHRGRTITRSRLPSHRSEA